MSFPIAYTATAPPGFRVTHGANDRYDLVRRNGVLVRVFDGRNSFLVRART